MKKKYSAGHVVYFHHLHDEREAETVTDKPDQWGEHEYEIEGKVRPMLVVGHGIKIDVGSATATDKHSPNSDCLIYKVKGRLCYLVLSLQSKIPEAARRHVENSGDLNTTEATPIKPKVFLTHHNLLSDKKTSHIDLRRTYLYPEQSVAKLNDQVIAKGVLDQIIKEMNFARLKPKTMWER